MRAESERHHRVAGIRNPRLQSQSITYFVVYLELERPRPNRTEIRIVIRVENRRDEVRSAPRHAKCALGCEAMNRVSTRGLIHRHPVFVAVKRETRARDTAGPRKENRDAAAMRMLAPGAGIGGPCDDIDRAGAVAETLAPGFGHNHGSFALYFKRYEFHGNNLQSGEVSRESSSRESGIPRVGKVYFRGATETRTTIARLARNRRLTSGRVHRGVRHRRRRVRRCAPVLH